MPPPTVTGRSLHGLPDVWPHGWTWHGKHGSGQVSMDKGDGLLAMGTPTCIDFQVLAEAWQEDVTQPDVYFISLQLQEVPAPTLSTTLLCDVSTGQHRPHIHTYIPPDLRMYIIYYELYKEHCSSLLSGLYSTVQCSYHPHQIEEDILVSFPCGSLQGEYL